MELQSGTLGEFIDKLKAAPYPPLMTLDAILDEAKRFGYGKKKNLRYTFVKYQKIGLLGNYVEKEPRQGGGGLWHPSQGVLFDLYLRLRKEQKADTISMANIPIGFWLLDSALGEWIPIPIEQTQSAFDHATEGYLDRWNRRASSVDRSKRSSKISRGIQEANRLFTSEGLKIKTPEDRKIWEEFTHFDPRLYQPGVSLEKFMGSGLTLRDTAPESQAMLKRFAYVEVQDRLVGLRYRNELCEPDAQPFWYWARDHWLDALEWASQRQAWFKSITPIEAIPESVNTILERSIIYLLGEFGRGIRRIQAGDAIPGVLDDFFKKKE